MTPKTITLIGVIGSIASVFSLLVYFIPASSQNSAPDKTVSMGNDNTNNQIIVGDTVTVTAPAKEKKAISSTSDLLDHSHRIANLPPDIFDAVHPGINIEFLEEILGKSNNKIKTDGATVLRYELHDSILDVLSIDGSIIDAVTVEAKPEGSNIGFRFPKMGEISLDFQLGVTSWNDAMRVFVGIKPKYTYAGRWFRLYLDNYYGADGKYMTFILGGKCDVPEIQRVNDNKEDFDAWDEPVSIVSGGEKKITYLILSRIDDLSKYDFIPICF